MLIFFLSHTSKTTKFNDIHGNYLKWPYNNLHGIDFLFCATSRNVACNNVFSIIHGATCCMQQCLFYHMWCKMLHATMYGARCYMQQCFYYHTWCNMLHATMSILSYVVQNVACNNVCCKLLHATCFFYHTWCNVACNKATISMEIRDIEKTIHTHI